MTDASVMPKYVATGDTPPSPDSDKSSDDPMMQAALVASAETYHQEQTVDLPSIAEDALPSVGAAASSAGSAVLPTPRTLTAAAVERMTLGPRSPSESD